MYTCCKISTLWNCVVSRKKVGSCKQEWKRARFAHDNIFFWIFTVWSIKLMMMQNQELILPLSESLRIFFRESWKEGETFKLTILQYVFLWYDSLHWNNWRTEIDYGSIIWSVALVSNSTIWKSFCVTHFEHLYSGCFILRDCRSQKVKLAQNKIFELCRKIRPYFTVSELLFQM